MYFCLMFVKFMAIARKYFILCLLGDRSHPTLRAVWYADSLLGQRYNCVLFVHAFVPTEYCD